MLQFIEIDQKTKKLYKRAEELFEDLDLHVKADSGERETIRIAFVGQYSAGKSSVIKMLTGEEAVRIGAGITTQDTTVYHWNGIEIVDTPGIHSQLRPDHDKISYQEIADSDMLVFVVTNELFDAHIAEHFRKLAIGQDKAAEMLLVVNKMDRTAEGNCAEQQNIIREDLRKVLRPYTPDQLHLCFLSAQDYLESKTLEDSDSELAEELRKVSGYDSFVYQLNRFAKGGRINAKLTTGLYGLQKQIKDALDELEGSISDLDIQEMEEYYTQKKNALVESWKQARQEIMNLFSNGAAQIKNYGVESAAFLEENNDEEKIEQNLKDNLRGVQRIGDECQEHSYEILKRNNQNYNIAVDAIDNSEFVKSLLVNMEKNYNKLPHKVRVAVEELAPDIKWFGNYLKEQAYAPGQAGSGLSLSLFEGSKIEKGVKAFGEKIGHTFKGTQTAKFSRAVAVGGYAINILGIVLSVTSQINEDRKQENAIEIRRENRKRVRDQFNSAADELETYGKDIVIGDAENQYNKSLDELEKHIKDMKKVKEDKERACNQLNRLYRECDNLIRTIHTA